MLSRDKTLGTKKKKTEEAPGSAGRRSTAADKRTIETSHNLAYTGAMNKKKGVQLQ